MTIYRASITTAGFQAGRLYELSDDDLVNPIAVELIAGGFLVEQKQQDPLVLANAPANVHGSALPIVPDPYANGDGPYTKLDGFEQPDDVQPEATTRTGVPELPDLQ